MTLNFDDCRECLPPFSCHQDACIPVINTVLDNCLYGDNVVVSKVLDSGPDGEYPPKSNHDAVLRKFVSSHYAVSHFKMHIDNIIYPLLCTSHYSGTS